MAMASTWFGSSWRVRSTSLISRCSSKTEVIFSPSRRRSSPRLHTMPKWALALRSSRAMAWVASASPRSKCCLRASRVSAFCPASHSFRASLATSAAFWPARAIVGRARTATATTTPRDRRTVGIEMKNMPGLRALVSIPALEAAQPVGHHLHDLVTDRVLRASAPSWHAEAVVGAVDGVERGLRQPGQHASQERRVRQRVAACPGRRASARQSTTDAPRARRRDVPRGAAGSRGRRVRSPAAPAAATCDAMRPPMERPPMAIHGGASRASVRTASSTARQQRSRTGCRSGMRRPASRYGKSNVTVVQPAFARPV